MASLGQSMQPPLVTNPSTPSHHTKDGTFQIPPEWSSSYKHKGFSDILKLQYEMATSNNKVPSEEEMPNVSFDWNLVRNPQENNTIQYSWIGHSTFLCQVGGYNILTDPVFSNRASFVQFAGPSRLRPVPCQISELPQIDIVIISHNHYDHLDYDAVSKIVEHHKNVVFYVPYKLKKWFLDYIEGIKEENVVELDWWQDFEHDPKTGNNVHGSIKLTFLPVQHWSLRTGRDRNATLWGAWGLVYKPTNSELPNRVLFHCGDTGYNEHIFKAIGERFSKPNGGIDFAMIPIGAYEPRWFMKNEHVNPEEAFVIAKEIHAKHSVGMHWGTFVLTTEPILEPKQRLEKLVVENNEDKDFFITLKHGESHVHRQ